MDYEDRLATAFAAGKAAKAARRLALSCPHALGTPSAIEWHSGYRHGNRRPVPTPKISCTFEEEVYARLTREAVAANISFAKRLRQVLAEWATSKEGEQHDGR